MKGLNNVVCITNLVIRRQKQELEISRGVRHSSTQTL